MTLCLLPGLDGTGRLYRRLVAELAPEFDVQVLDYQSDVFESYQSLAEIIRLRLPKNRPFFLVAESFAGPLSVLVAAKRPHGMRGLIIAASFLRSPITQAGLLAHLLRCIPSSVQPPLALLEAILMGGWEDSHIREELNSALTEVHPAVLKSRLKAAMQVDVRNEFDQIAVPVLYLRAVRDRLLRPGVARDFATVINPPLQRDLEAPHFMFQAIAPQTARYIHEFVADISQSNR